MFENRRADGSHALSPEACTYEGNCDLTAFRDASVPDPLQSLTYLKLYIHVMAMDNGSNPATTEANVTSQIAVLNVDYLPHRIQFEYEMRFVNDTRYRYCTTEPEFDQMKDLYALDPANQINIFVCDVNIGGDVYSFATFPWDAYAFSNRGGIVMSNWMFYPYESATLTHEMGHCLGLFHTFRGVSETVTCGPCYEQVGGLDRDETGDFCSDTPPTPLSYSCSAPGGIDPCSGLGWGATAPQNYMSYAPSSCQTEFTLQQSGRIHCWIEDALQDWTIAFDIAATPQLGPPPLSVDFQGTTDRTTTAWSWDFGDLGTSELQNPTHEYTAPGYYTVTATVQTPGGPFEKMVEGLVAVPADSLFMGDAQIVEGRAVVEVSVRNYVALKEITLPFIYDGPLDLSFDSISTVGLRTEYMRATPISLVPAWKVATVYLDSELEPLLPPGDGPVARLYFTAGSSAGSGVNPIEVTSYSLYSLDFETAAGNYVPADFGGVISRGCCQGVVGDVNGDGSFNPTIGDVSTLIDHLFITGTPLQCLLEADVNQSGGITPLPADITIGDVSLLIDNLFIGGTALPECY